MNKFLSWFKKTAPSNLEGGYQPLPSENSKPAPLPPPKNPSSPTKEKITRKPRKPKVVAPLPEPENPEKIEATRKGEPWVTVKSVTLDPVDIGTGAFELDYNDIFVARLVKAGFKGKTDHDLVDQWFSAICRNVLSENYEQAMADPELRTSIISKRDLGDGRTEVS